MSNLLRHILDLSNVVYAFQLWVELTTAKVFLVISLVTLPTQFPREIILPLPLASLRTW